MRPVAVRSDAGGTGRIFATTILVAFVAALSLRLTDAVAGFVTSSSRGIRRHATIGEAEARLGTRLVLPAYFPEGLGWPPSEVRTTSDPRAALVELPGRSGSAWVLRFVQVLDPASPIPRRLLPPADSFHRLEVDLDGTPAVLLRIDLKVDGTWDELSFVRSQRRIVLRFRGPTSELLAIARSIERGM